MTRKKKREYCVRCNLVTDPLAIIDSVDKPYICSECQNYASRFELEGKAMQYRFPNA